LPAGKEPLSCIAPNTFPRFSALAWPVIPAREQLNSRGKGKRGHALLERPMKDQQKNPQQPSQPSLSARGLNAQVHHRQPSPR